MPDTYNGWTNYATWRVHLELISDYADSLERDRQTFTDPGTLAEHFEEYTDEAITNYGENKESIAVGYARAFVSDCNWEEMAEHYPDLIETDDDEEETSDDPTDPTGWYRNAPKWTATEEA
jgi:hypothetical protein